MSIEGAVADRKALAETLADILDRWVPTSEDRCRRCRACNRASERRRQQRLREAS